MTGALGGGGVIPKHPQELALARLLLEAGADVDVVVMSKEGLGELVSLGRIAAGKTPDTGPIVPSRRCRERA